MTIRIEIETIDHSLPASIIGTPDPSPGASTTEPRGLTITYASAGSRRAIGPCSPAVFEFVLNLAAGFTSSLAANWLFSKIQGRANRLTIGHSRVPISQASIQEALDSTSARSPTSEDTKR